MAVFTAMLLCLQVCCGNANCRRLVWPLTFDLLTLTMTFTLWLLQLTMGQSPHQPFTLCLSLINFRWLFLTYCRHYAVKLNHLTEVDENISVYDCKVVNCPPAIACIGNIVQAGVGTYNYILYNFSLAVGSYRKAYTRIACIANEYFQELNWLEHQ